MKLRITVQGQSYNVDVEVLDGAPVGGVATAGASVPAPASAHAAVGAVQDVLSPIAGSVLSIPVSVGDTVGANDTVLVLEAMKMESNIGAPSAGTVREILVKPGDHVTQGQVLLRVG